MHHLSHGQILVFNHGCSPQSRLFCLQLPFACPTCNEPIETPERLQNGGLLKTLPSPLKCASSSSCALAIRPSMGHFLTDYQNACDLHICLTTSDGRVVEFDQKGARIAPPASSMPNSEATVTPHNPWDSCLIIKIFDHRPTWEVARLWDRQLEQFVSLHRWAAEAYETQSNNCFDFVLEFLRSLNLDTFKSSIVSKTTFCEHFIVPRTKLLARYISLFRKLQTEQTVTLLND